MTSIEHYEKIEDYLKGKLTTEEQQAFEVLIDKNEELAAEVELHRDMIDATGDQEMIDFRKQLDTIAEEVAPADNSGGRGPWRTLLLAALLILTGLMAWWWMSPGMGSGSEEAAETETVVEETPFPNETAVDGQEEAPPNEQEQPPTDPSATKEESLGTDQETPPIAEEKTASQPDYRAIAMADYNVPDIGVRTKGEETEELPSTLEQAQEAFRKGNYQQVVSLLQAPPSGQQQEWRYTRGHAYWQLQEFEQAANDFAQLTESFSYGYDADWNLLLSLAAQLPESRKEYQAQLEKVTAEGHPFAEQANELHDKLEEAGLNQ